MNFKTYSDAFKAETEFRANLDSSKLCTFGIKALDDAMVAIAPNELIVIGACSGYGKTELALAISRHNAMQGKRVAHYHLEGGSIEAMQRMKWRDICDHYYSEYSKEGIDLDFRNWSMNCNQDPLLTKIESDVYSNLKERLDNKLYFYDKPQGLTCDEFLASILDFHDLKVAFENPFNKPQKMGFDLDLIVIDHLQYFSLDKEENEIAEITRILRDTKKIADNENIPVILVSHLRKLPRKHGMPDKEDLYGTSNIHKIANTCIIIHPDHEKDKSYEGLYPTYLRVAKSRIGIRPNELIYVDFNIHKRSYEDKYKLVKCFPDGSISDKPLFKLECPKWYKGELINENMDYRV